MADFSMKREQKLGGIRYTLEGIFTGQAAFELKRAIESEHGRVELDFAKVRQFFDYGLAAFATELQSPECQRILVELRGLGLHHRRLLHYFGLELDRAAATPEVDDLSADALPLRALVTL
jgi:hypothetical protein